MFLAHQFARRSMVDSTPPRLVAATTTCRVAHTASAVAAPPPTSKASIAPKPSIWATPRHAPDRRADRGTAPWSPRDGRAVDRPGCRPTPASGPVGAASCAVRAAPGTIRAHPGSRRPVCVAGRPGPPFPVAGDGDPSNRSACPPMNFVALCSTRSAPKDSGRCPSGVANVLSTTTSAPVPWPNRHSSGRSATSISGLVGDSSQSRSAAQAACLVAAVSVMSTVRDLPPADGRAVGQQRPHAGIGVSGHHHLRAGRHQVENRRRRGHPGPERDSGAALQRADGGLERLPTRRAAVPRILGDRSFGGPGPEVGGQHQRHVHRLARFGRRSAGSDRDGVGAQLPGRAGRISHRRSVGGPTWPPITPASLQKLPVHTFDPAVE